MKKSIAAMLLLGVFLLSGCSLLNRDYSSVQPHSSSYYENEDRSVLRAESYQDIINDLLLLIGSHEESGTIWLYPGTEELDVAQAAQQACQEVKQETPMGAYAVDYITYTTDENARNYDQISLTIGYRRTAEQLEAMVHATSESALYDLLTAAVTSDASELTVQLGSFNSQESQVQQTVEQVRRENNISSSEIWQVNYYPTPQNAGIIEIILRTEQP